jgi:hypothetical protein
MAEESISEEELLKYLAESAPPTIPDESFGAHCPELGEIAGWNKNFAASIVGGLLTSPQLHVHGVRLDWLQRLVISKANGRRKIRRRDLARILNVGLVKAKVAQLEDPIEDLFCELLVCDFGSFRIFTGHWESAAALTQTVIEAFLLLPESTRKRTSLESAISLLKISDLLAKRSGVVPHAALLAQCQACGAVEHDA